MNHVRPATLLAATAASTLLLVGCSSAEPDAGSPQTDDAATVEVEDNFGTQTVPLPANSVVSTDNRTFETLSEWGIPLTAAPRGLMPDTIPYASDESIVDLGNHREPDLEAVVAADPDLIINGQRFQDYRDNLISLAPEATVVELDPREGEPFDGELKRQTTVLGEVFGKETEAEQLVADFDDAIARTTDAYDSELTVLAINVSGGELGYLAPTEGRALGPIYDIVGLTPALEVDGSDDHTGDDVSVEAIAESNPDWIMVIDRDAAVESDTPDYQPAADILEGSEALQNVTAIQEGNLVYMPADSYTNEGIQTYTEFFNDFADGLAGQG